MLHHLLESGPRARQRSTWTIASTGAHLAMIATAVALTLREPAERLVPVRFDDPIYVAPVQPEHHETARTPSSPTSSWTAPQRVPVTLPDVPAIQFAPQPTLSSLLAESFGPGLGAAPSATPTPGTQVYSAHAVERTVMPYADNPRPAYPESLRAAFVEGSVLVQFVVDTTGRIERSSIVVVRATHSAFADAVRRWLPQTRYSPAEVHGQRVRQLVQQEVGFTLQR